MKTEQMSNITKLVDRKCKDCGEVKPLNNFVKSKSGRLGYSNQCKACRCKARHENGEYLRERLRKHQYRHEAPTHYTDDLIHRLRSADKCCYCGEPFVDEKLHAMQPTLDHVYRGVNIDDNIVVCHRACNTAKGTQHIYDFYQSSERFNETLWSAILKDWLGRLYKREVTDADIPYLTECLHQESLEYKAVAANE